MKKYFPKKVHIIGSVGSGKTTFARRLSSKLNVPYYELDNVVWKRSKNGDERNNPENRDVILNNIVGTDEWIVEGVHSAEWVSQSFQNAEVIILLDISFSIRKYRIIKMFILQRLGLEKANYKPTFKILLMMFRYNSYFENEDKSKILKQLDIYKDKLIILSTKKEIKNTTTNGWN